MYRLETPRKVRRSRIEICIDLFVSETGYVPLEARPVADARELSPQLEQLAGTIRAPHAWRAWAVGPRIWFLDGLLEGSMPAPARPTLDLTFRDHDAEAGAAGVWRRSAHGRWDRAQVVASNLMSAERHQRMRRPPMNQTLRRGGHRVAGSNDV